MAEIRFRRKKHRWKESSYSEKATKKEKLDTNRRNKYCRKGANRRIKKKKSKKDKRKEGSKRDK